MSPFADVTLAIDEAGLCQSLDASRDYLVADGQADLLAPHYRPANNHGRFVPSQIHT
jgi:hypothetical protein